MCLISVRGFFSISHLHFLACRQAFGKACGRVQCYHVAMDAFCEELEDRPDYRNLRQEHLLVLGDFSARIEHVTLALASS